jgi:hypothetical protein
MAVKGDAAGIPEEEDVVLVDADIFCFMLLKDKTKALRCV